MKLFLTVLFLSFNFCLGQISLGLPGAYAQSREFRQLRSNHFIIEYQQGVDRGYARDIKDKAEEFYRKITQEFHLVRDKLWLWDNRAKIFIAAGKKQYLNKFNCPSWSAACVDYRNKEIYTYPSQKGFISMLAHELTHIIFREYTQNQQLPLWLDEGMAMYIESRLAGVNYKGMASRMKNIIKEGRYIDFAEFTAANPLFLKNKPSSYVDIFYLQAFFVVSFIIERYQRYRFSRFLWNFRNGGSAEEALAKTYYQLKDYQELEKRWKKFYGR